jgi:hypothetical protein
MPSADNPVGRAVLVAGETIVPGGSHLLKGDIRQGLIYLVAGNLARAIFGGPGVALVAADSFTKATTGARLTDHLLGGGGTPAPPPAPAREI